MTLSIDYITGFAFCRVTCGHFHQHSSRPASCPLIRLLTGTWPRHRNRVQYGVDRGHSHCRRGTGARANPTQGTPGKDSTPYDWVVTEILLKRQLGEGQLCFTNSSVSLVFVVVVVVMFTVVPCPSRFILWKPESQTKECKY